MTDRVLKGGSAIMLDVDSAAMPAPYDNNSGHHCTLQFVGRNLPIYYAAGLIAAATRILPMPLRATGACRRFATTKGSYLVLEIERTEELRTVREYLRGQLTSAGIRWRDDFDWSPHVTLAEAPPGTAFALPEPVAPFDVKCTHVTCKLGDQRIRFEL